MNHRRSIIAISALAAAVVTATATEASAKVPPEDTSRPATVVPHDPPPTRTVEIPVDDNSVETLQAGASALGGAGIALAGMWLYRRRQTHTA
jgi:hypothetical protein